MTRGQVLIRPPRDAGRAAVAHLAEAERGALVIAGHGIPRHGEIDLVRPG